MKSGRRKDWEALLNQDKVLPWEFNQILMEWIEEWIEFEVESYRMSEERFAQHKIEKKKIQQYAKKSKEYDKHAEKIMKEMDSPVKVHK